MYKLIIADDEPMIGIMLERLVDYRAVNIELAAIVHNGGELLDAIREHQPDIVITDIFMPKFDGLQVLKAIRDEGLDCHFIIISGYREFNYAHQALKYNVDDYLLKPINKNELLAALKRVISLIEAKNRASLEESRADALTSLFFEELTKCSEPTDCRPEQLLRKYNISLQGDAYRIIKLKIDVKNREETWPESPLSIQSKLLRCLELDLSQAGISSTGCILSENMNIFTSCNSEQISDIRFKQLLRSSFDKLKNFTDVFVGLALTMGVSCAHQQPEELLYAYWEADHGIWLRLFSASSHIIYAQPYCSSAPALIGAFAGGLKKVEDSLNSMEPDELRKGIDKLFAFPSTIQAEYDYKRTFTKLIRMLPGTNFGRVCQNLNLQSVEMGLSFDLANDDSIDVLKGHFLAKLSNAMRQAVASSESSTSKSINAAIDYMKQHYMCALSLDEIADRVKLSPSYFSALFKEKMGIGFNDYLTTLRIEQAQRLLLETTMKVNKIAQTVGYPDAHYFSKVFYKRVGIKATEYRKLLG